MNANLLDKRESRIRRMFGSIAPSYDFLNHLLSLNVDHYWRWRTTRLLPPSGSAPILDVCTGTGDLAFAYDRAAKGKLTIYAADFCPEMLELGRAKARRRRAEGRIRFVEADAQHLPFASNTFQIAAVAFGLRNVTDTDRGIREMVRVVQPGGRVAILEFSQPRTPILAGLYGFYFRRVLPVVGQLISRSEDQAYRYLPESVQEFPSGPALVERLEAAGLADVAWHPLTMGIASLYVGTKRAATAAVKATAAALAGDDGEYWD